MTLCALTLCAFLHDLGDPALLHRPAVSLMQRKPDDPRKGLGLCCCQFPADFNRVGIERDAAPLEYGFIHSASPITDANLRPTAVIMACTHGGGLSSFS